MAWLGTLGHDEVVTRFQRALARGRLASSFLFVGPEGIGKRRFAFGLAQTLLCATRPEALMDPCGTCPACVQVRDLTHPDLDYVRKPDDKSFLPLDLLVGDKEHRGKEGLCHRLAMKPFMGGRKVAIIDDADYLNPEGANSLLKTLEEPPPYSVLILIGTSPAKQLPTIRSRCQLVRFQPLDPETVKTILLNNDITDRPDDAERISQHCGGSVQRAIELADPTLWTLRHRIWELLGQPRIDWLGLAAEILQYAEQAGRDGAARRDRLRQAIFAVTDFFEQQLLMTTGIKLDATGQDTLRAQRSEIGRNILTDPTAVAKCIDRCLDAAEHVDRNAHPATLVECWLDDLAAQMTSLLK